MDNLNNTLHQIFKVENTDEILFKKVEITNDKIIFFAFKKIQVIVRGKLSSASIEPVGFILKMDDEYHYCQLNDDKIDEKVINEFLNRIYDEN